jgi:hypothetical protein
VADYANSLGVRPVGRKFSPDMTKSCNVPCGATFHADVNERIDDADGLEKSEKARASIFTARIRYLLARVTKHESPDPSAITNADFTKAPTLPQ